MKRLWDAYAGKTWFWIGNVIALIIFLGAIWLGAIAPMLGRVHLDPNEMSRSYRD